MMSQVSKNSAGTSSETKEVESVMLFQRPVMTLPTKTTAEKIEASVVTTQTSPSPVAGAPGIISLHPSLLSSLQQGARTAPGLPANPTKAAGSAGASQNGAVSKVTGKPGAATTAVSPAGKAKGSASPDMSALQQQFEHLQMINNTLANTKEKTPMCLINELARFNKVQHQYTLIDEQGPAHKKTFYVKLKLGEEEYSAQGPSIKKAQHAAASSALTSTGLHHPPPKPSRTSHPGASNLNNITPTVELNALAMKRGEPAVYKPIEPRHPPYYPPPNFDFRGMYNQRYHYPRMPRMFFTSLKVGQREFIGEGPTRQAARHMAATKALKMLRLLPMPSHNTANNKEEEEMQKPLDDVDDKDPLKSEISLVHEIALKRNLEVVFEVIRESGPPHMKVFVTQCRVGDCYTEAQGNSKKLSKKIAAEKMLEQLRQLPPVSTTLRAKPKMVTNKKKNRNLIKVETLNTAQKADPGYGVGINPISRLIQIMQAQKKKEPIYTLITERGLPRRREFVMQVTVEEKTCTGVGPNKKLAKRSAAEGMLQLLGFSRPSPQPSKPALKSGFSDIASGDKKVTFSDADEAKATNGKGSRQLMPGLLFLPEKSGQSSLSSKMLASQAGGDNPLVASFLNSSGSLRPEQQLVALSATHNFKVEFDDFSGKECLCRVTLSTTPNQSVHGTGSSREAARDAASLAALGQLLEKGIVDLNPILGGEEKCTPKDGTGNPSATELGVTLT